MAQSQESPEPGQSGIRWRKEEGCGTSIPRSDQNQAPAVYARLIRRACERNAFCGMSCFNDIIAGNRWGGVEAEDVGAPVGTVSGEYGFEDGKTQSVKRLQRAVCGWKDKLPGQEECLWLEASTMQS